MANARLSTHASTGWTVETSYVAGNVPQSKKTYNRVYPQVLLLALSVINSNYPVIKSCFVSAPNITLRSVPTFFYFFSGIVYKPAVSQFLLPGLKILPSNNIQTPAHWPRLYLLLSNSGLLKDILNQFCTAKPFGTVNYVSNKKRQMRWVNLQLKKDFYASYCSIFFWLWTKNKLFSLSASYCERCQRISCQSWSSLGDFTWIIYVPVFVFSYVLSSLFWRPISK